MRPYFNFKPLCSGKFSSFKKFGSNFRPLRWIRRNVSRFEWNKRIPTIPFTTTSFLLLPIAAFPTCKSSNFPAGRTQISSAVWKRPQDSSYNSNFRPENDQKRNLSLAPKAMKENGQCTNKLFSSRKGKVTNSRLNAHSREAFRDKIYLMQ